MVTFLVFLYLYAGLCVGLCIYDFVANTPTEKAVVIGLSLLLWPAVPILRMVGWL